MKLSEKLCTGIKAKGHIQTEESKEITAVTFNFQVPENMLEEIKQLESDSQLLSDLFELISDGERICLSSLGQNLFSCARPDYIEIKDNEKIYGLAKTPRESIEAAVSKWKDDAKTI